VVAKLHLPLLVFMIENEAEMNGKRKNIRPLSILAARGGHLKS